MADRYNEGKALDAVLRFIEARDNALRKDDGRSPDDLMDPDRLRRVDYVCTVGQLFYALEHTRIEPFPNQIKLADQHQNLSNPSSRGSIIDQIGSCGILSFPSMRRQG
jgi:hypothetical protein